MSSVEGGGSGGNGGVGAIGGGGLTLGVEISAFGAAPIGGFGLELRGPSLPFINEGPASADLLKNTMSIRNLSLFPEETPDSLVPPIGGSILGEAEQIVSAAWEKPFFPLELVLAQAQISVLLAQAGSIDIRPNPRNNLVITEPSTIGEPSKAASSVFITGLSTQAFIQPAIEPIYPQPIRQPEPMIIPAPLRRRLVLADYPTPTVPIQAQMVAEKPALQEQVLTEVAEEEVAMEVDKAEDTKVDVQEEEKVDKGRILHIVDKKGIFRRVRHIISQALKVARDLKGKGEPVKIRGADLLKHLLPSNRSEIRGGEINSKDPQERVPDKTWDATLEMIAPLEFTSESQLKSEVKQVVEDNHPVILATSGEIASEKSVTTSHQHINGKPHALLEFERRKRLIKQRVVRIVRIPQQPNQVLFEEGKEQVKEGTIQDLDIADVFPQAA